MKVVKETRLARIKQTAEVFTPKELIHEMLNKLSKEFWEEDKTFCDPSAGNGNFLEEIYRYKVEKYHHEPTIALSTIYGVELLYDNVAEMKIRMYRLAKSYGVESKKAQNIIQKNIVCHDALTYHWEFDDIFIEAKHMKNNENEISHLKDSNKKWYTIDEVKQAIKENKHFNLKGLDIIIENDCLKLKDEVNFKNSFEDLPVEKINI